MKVFEEYEPCIYKDLVYCENCTDKRIKKTIVIDGSKISIYAHGMGENCIEGSKND